MPKHSCLLVAVALLCAAQRAGAADISRGLRGADATSQNYLELGIGLAASNAPRLRGDQRSISDDVRLVPLINGRYAWRGWFVENFAESRQGLTFGYALVESDDWALDLTLNRRHRPIGPEISAELAGIKPRKGDTVLGARASGYIADYLWQLQVGGDIGDAHRGIGASALLGRQWQWRNWNLHALAGVSYSSARTNDYYFGIDSIEAQRSGLPAYRAGAAFGASAEAGLTYALSESWVFRATARLGGRPSAVADSPLFEQRSRHAVGGLLSLTFVF